MPAYLQKLQQSFRAARELGLRPLGLYAWYKFGLLSGLMQARTDAALRKAIATPAGRLVTGSLPTLDTAKLKYLIYPETRTDLMDRCDEIRNGWTRIFANQPAEIVPSNQIDLREWTAVDHDAGEIDVKYLWEPARFGWVYPLAQAYTLGAEDDQIEVFFAICERFFTAKPPYRGVQWVSAQEVAFRLIGLAFAAWSFGAGNSLTAQQQDTLAQWIAVHAARIPPTLAYARAQNNNHLLAEAAGLLTAGALLPDHPQAESWRLSGWKWLQQGLRSQIEPTGEYIQHSTNYHRLMMQIVIWAAVIGEKVGYQWDGPVLARIQASINWLAALVDPHTGKTPNLGPNDGALLFPLSQCEFEDYRPTLQVAYKVFFGHPLYPPGPWDDLSAWFGIDPGSPQPAESVPARNLQPLTLHHPEVDSWCYLRAANFIGRPGHADQLHVDLWWRGTNIALDPGTYQYNAPPPWDNALTRTTVHNTVTLDGQEQMQRAGRFLYVDQANTEIIKAAPDQVSASHDGYRQFNLKHQRSVETSPGGWRVTDRILPLGMPMGTPHTIALHWQLPDWPWSIDEIQNGFGIALDSPDGTIRIEITVQMKPDRNTTPSLSLMRAGECQYGEKVDQPTWGWVSPHYGLKYPALAVCCQVVGTVPITLRTDWHLLR